MKYADAICKLDNKWKFATYFLTKTKTQWKPDKKISLHWKPG